jgi:hypothetical protein
MSYSIPLLFDVKKLHFTQIGFFKIIMYDVLHACGYGLMITAKTQTMVEDL